MRKDGHCRLLSVILPLLTEDNLVNIARAIASEVERIGEEEIEAEMRRK